MSSAALSTATKLDDTTLLKQIQTANRQEAFSELVRRHQGAVYRSCYRILGNDEDAKDASQEAFLRAYTKLETFRGRSTFKTWLVRVAMNVSLNEYASRRKVPHTTSGSTHLLATSAEGDPEATLIGAEAAT